MRGGEGKRCDDLALHASVSAEVGRGLMAEQSSAASAKERNKMNSSPKTVCHRQGQQCLSLS